MYWAQTAGKVFQVLSTASFVFLLLFAIFSIVIFSLWLADSPPSLMHPFWGLSILLTLCVSIAASAVSFLVLGASAVITKSVTSRPSTAVSYALIAWASASTFVFLEVLPWKWDDRVAAVEQALLADASGELTRLFVADTQCAVEREEHCWRQIAPFVDRHFFRYAAPYVGLYPAHIACSVILLIAG
jgi:hypothetical protein